MSALARRFGIPSLAAVGVLVWAVESRPRHPAAAPLPDTAPRSGRDPRAAIFVQRGCGDCHAISALGVKAASDVGPDLTFAYADVVNRYGTTLERFMDDPRGIMRLVLASHVQLSGADRDSITHVLHQVYNEHWPQMDEWIPSLPPGANSETGPRSRDVRALRPYYTGKSFTGR